MRVVVGSFARPQPPMTRFTPVAFAFAIGLSLAGAAASNPRIVEIVWSADGRFEHRAPVAAGSFVELCGKLAGGQAVRWRYEASAPLDFNIHHHVGKDVVYSARQDQISVGADTLVVRTPEDHCWMWRNKGAMPVQLAVTLAR